jgi:hypothetical protein
MRANESTTASAPVFAASSVCSGCGAAFRCGMTAGDAQCWCYSLPHIVPLPTANAAAASCLCPACLQALMDKSEHE